MKKIEIAETIDLILYKYYFERGQNVPDWKPQPDPQWWTDYLNEINES